MAKKAATPKKGKKLKQRTGPYLFPAGPTPRATTQGFNTSPGSGTGNFGGGPATGGV